MDCEELVWSCLWGSLLRRDDKIVELLYCPSPEVSGALGVTNGLWKIGVELLGEMIRLRVWL